MRRFIPRFNLLFLLWVTVFVAWGSTMYVLLNEPPPKFVIMVPEKASAGDVRTELHNRIRVSAQLWAAGDAMEVGSAEESGWTSGKGHMKRCTAVGVLDASVPIPGLNQTSSFGPLRELIEQVNLGGWIERQLGRESYARLYKLSTRHYGSQSYLLLTYDQYSELMSLLKKIKFEEAA